MSFQYITISLIFVFQHTNTPLVITGCGLGGYLAILSTLQLHKVVDEEESNGKKTKKPICITFGSPLIGDQALQRAISERPQWESSFLNVVAIKDRVACYFSSESQYKPLGTSLFCTESGGHTAFEDQDSVLAVLKAMESSDAGNMELCDYENDLKSMRRNMMYRGVSALGEVNSDCLKEGTTLQFKEINVLGIIPNNLIGEVEEKRRKMIKSKKNKFEPTKTLNEMKISLTYMEWYMKSSKAKGGYYDGYKNPQSREEIEKQQLILRHKRKLTQYWEKIVKEKNLIPQKEGAKLRKRWLYGGTNYRRIVEPLDIAEHYKKNKTNYSDVRPDHYKLLEKWSNEDKKDSNASEEKRNKAASLTEDSCFWAQVEDALIAVKELRDGALNNNKGGIKKELEQFEAYLMLSIKNFSVSPDIFLEGSSLMEWWKEYKAYKENSYASEFANYMKTNSYYSYE
ncbi:senescence-associated carboxylesterase 101-like protein [Tanacetum coccineum]